MWQPWQRFSFSLVCSRHINAFIITNGRIFRVSDFPFKNLYDGKCRMPSAFFLFLLAFHFPSLSGRYVGGKRLKIPIRWFIERFSFWCIRFCDPAKSKRGNSRYIFVTECDRINGGPFRRFYNGQKDSWIKLEKVLSIIFTKEIVWLSTLEEVRASKSLMLLQLNKIQEVRLFIVRIKDVQKTIHKNRSLNIVL